MAKLIEVRRLVIICDTSIERLIQEEVMKAGARGYNCVYCFGKGRHEEVEDPFTGRSRVRIEVLTQPAVAEKVLDFLHRPDFDGYPVTAFLDTVEVDARDTFF